MVLFMLQILWVSVSVKISSVLSCRAQLKLAATEKSIYWLMLLRSPGRGGGSICRHSWISDLSASVFLCMYVSIYSYIYLSLPPLLHLSLFSASLRMLASFSSRKGWGKVAISPHPMVLSPQDPGGKWLVSLSLFLSVSHMFTYQRLWKTHMGNLPSLNQSP